MNEIDEPRAGSPIGESASLLTPGVLLVMILAGLASLAGCHHPTP